jgi:hypothetical protein
MNALLMMLTIGISPPPAKKYPPPIYSTSSKRYLYSAPYYPGTIKPYISPYQQSQALKKGKK